MDSTRLRLIAAAVRLFQIKGYAGAGLSEILAQAGASKGALYHHFSGGKEPLAVAAVGVIANEVDRFLATRAEADSKAGETLAALAGLTGKWLARTDFAQGGLLSTLAAGDLTETPDLAAAIRTAQQRWIRWFSERLPGLTDAAAQIEAQAALALLDGAIAAARLHRSSDLVANLVGPTANHWTDLANRPQFAADAAQQPRPLAPPPSAA